MENHLLTRFLTLHETYVFRGYLGITSKHATLLDLRRRQQRTDQHVEADGHGELQPFEQQNMSEQQQELYASLYGLWKLLARAIENHTYYATSLQELRKKYFDPDRQVPALVADHGHWGVDHFSNNVSVVQAVQGS